MFLDLAQAPFDLTDRGVKGRVAARALDAYAKVFSALRNLGFREREARGVLDALRQEPASAGLGLEALLREALQRMTRRSCR